MPIKLPQTSLNKINREILKFVPVVVFLFLWQVCSLLFGGTNFPSLVDIASSLFNSKTVVAIISSQGGGDNGMLGHWFLTFCVHLAGLISGTALGLAFTIFLFLKKSIRNVLEPFFTVARTIPPLIFAPFLLLIFNGGILANFAIVAIYVFYAVVVYGLNSLDLVPMAYIELAKIHNSNGKSIVFYILLPGMLPQFYGGLRVVISISLGVLVVGEYIGPGDGLGKVMKYAMSYSRLDLLIAAIICCVVVAILNDLLITRFFKRFMKWDN
ncbi:hypothetical protein BEL04_08675 [Mucilaginibacter sp. PPCGB 2223]|uniref:ABC transporter permease n=1 Tax=Mucilaginibacter sp. PPCGB 2223 TaxID=1886027 RepID=UPI000826C179|nr:ABC transporter permease subunit [Mucilaginibacter sp. PPCGB 2223]OCX54323.1 hypothetical protein BEL04_08675 [Mucilaginibacter sp. PPCGB 2223]